jgi:DNA-binding phage protein
MAKSNGFTRYSTYNFIAKDPVIDVLRTMKADSGMTDTKIATLSNVSRNTLKNWFVGKTRRPQFATVAACAVAMGYKEVPLTSEGRRKLRGG